jgi:hypothetical protein
VKRVVVAVVLLAACTGAQRPEPLPAGAPTLDVCTAAESAAGTRVRMSAAFASLGSGPESDMFTADSGGRPCNDNGPGVVIATLWSEQAKDPLLGMLAGTPIVVEGTITEVEEGRIVHVDNALVREP